MTEGFAHNMASPIRMDHAIIRPSQSLVKGRGPAAQFRLSGGWVGRCCGPDSVGHKEVSCDPIDLTKWNPAR